MIEKEKTFESALEDLELIVKDLESGTIPLEEAMNKYTKAMDLVKFCQDKLDNATSKVNKILTDDNELKDFDVTENEE